MESCLLPGLFFMGIIQMHRHLAIIMEMLKMRDTLKASMLATDILTALT